MLFPFARRRAACLVPVGLALMAGSAVHAQTAVLARSSASALAANFQGTFVEAAIPPVAAVAGSFPRSYAQRASEPLLFRSVPLAAGAGVVPGLTVTAHRVLTRARGTADAARVISVNADAATGSVSLALVRFRDGSAVPGPAALKLGATGLRTNAQFSRTGSQQLTTAGTTASIGMLSISGPLVGNRTLTFSGVPIAEMVLLRSPTVTITLNRQAASLLEVCDPDCRAVITAVVAGAVDIQLSGADVFGTPLTGDIVFGLVRGSEG